MRVLQELMGHRDFKTTLIYADYAPSEREAEWVEKAFGPAAAADAIDSRGTSLSLTQRRRSRARSRRRRCVESRRAAARPAPRRFSAAWRDWACACRFPAARSRCATFRRPLQ